MPKKTPEESEHLINLYKLVTDVSKGRQTYDELRQTFKELSGKEAPETTTDWLKVAVVRLVQQRYYRERGLPLPDKVMKNDQQFFASQPPARQAEKEKKMSKKEAAGAEKKVEKKAGDERLLKWKKDADVAVIEKQKKAHVKLMLQLVQKAGGSGVKVCDMCAAADEQLKSDEAWTKHSHNAHVKYLLKAFADQVEAAG